MHLLQEKVLFAACSFSRGRASGTRRCPIMIYFKSRSVARQNHGKITLYKGKTTDKISRKDG